nr:bcl-2-interacting killer isoform X1 [Callithrix jacchus]
METPECAPVSGAGKTATHETKQVCRTAGGREAVNKPTGRTCSGSVANAIQTPVQHSALGVREAAPGAGRRGAGPGRGGASRSIRSRAGPRAADTTPLCWVADSAIIAAAAAAAAAAARGEMSEVRPLSSDIFMETLLCEQFVDPLTMEVVGGSDPEEDLDPVEDPLECMENSDALALQLACIADQMDVSLRARRLAQLYEVAMYSPGLAFVLDRTDIGDVLSGVVDVFANFQEDIVRLWRSLSSGSWVSRKQAVLLALLALLLAMFSGGLHLLLK